MLEDAEKRNVIIGVSKEEISTELGKDRELFDEIWEGELQAKAKEQCWQIM